MSEFMVTEHNAPPLGAFILSTFEEGIHRCRLKPSKASLRGYFAACAGYFQIHLHEYGIKKLGLIETALSDPAFRELVTSPAVVNGQKRKPYLEESAVDPRVLLKLAIELAGSPRLDNPHESGVGKMVPRLPSAEMEAEWGPNVGILQSLTIVFAHASRITDAKWAQKQNMTVNARLRKFAHEYGLERELREWSVPEPDLISGRIERLLEQIESYNEKRRQISEDVSETSEAGTNSRVATAAARKVTDAANAVMKKVTAPGKGAKNKKPRSAGVKAVVSGSRAVQAEGKSVRVKAAGKAVSQKQVSRKPANSNTRAATRQPAAAKKQVTPKPR